MWEPMRKTKHCIAWHHMTQQVLYWMATNNRTGILTQQVDIKFCDKSKDAIGHVQFHFLAVTIL
jgi:hypothetical protein